MENIENIEEVRNDFDECPFCGEELIDIDFMCIFCGNIID